MDFSYVDLSPEDQEFLDHTRAFIAKHVTDEVLRLDRETGENFSEPVHLALGEEGYLTSDFKQESEGGFDPVRRRIFHLEIGRAHTPCSSVSSRRSASATTSAPSCSRSPCK
jgi:3-oxocholest-4-en-26-oyl-CoA dehydrogenase alpha subunit